MPAVRISASGWTWPFLDTTMILCLALPQTQGERVLGAASACGAAQQPLLRAAGDAGYGQKSPGACINASMGVMEVLGLLL